MAFAPPEFCVNRAGSYGEYKRMFALKAELPLKRVWVVALNSEE